MNSYPRLVDNDPITQPSLDANASEEVVIVAGSFSTGFVIYGPFVNISAAEFWAEYFLKTGRAEWHIEPLVHHWEN